MKKVGIITATPEEFIVIKDLMKNIEIEEKYDLNFNLGEINGKEVVLVECGVGKVNSARTTQILIDYFEIEYIINVGVAGGLSDNLEIGDIVIGEKLVQHDFDITASGNHPKGYINKKLGRELLSDANLVNKCKNIIENDLKEINTKIGIIATGDVFCYEVSMKESIVKEFNADCVEMEGASIAQVCTLCNIPFIVIRSISDKPNGHNNVDFENYIVSSSKRVSKILELLIKE